MKLVKFALGAMAGVSSVYGVGAFIGWSWDAGTWDALGRGLVGIVGPMVGLVCGLIVANDGEL